MTMQSVAEVMAAMIAGTMAEVPEITEREEVFKYLLSMGFSKKEALRVDPLSAGYGLARKGMLYQKNIQKDNR